MPTYEYRRSGVTRCPAPGPPGAVRCHWEVGDPVVGLAESVTVSVGLVHWHGGAPVLTGEGGRA